MTGEPRPLLEARSLSKSYRRERGWLMGSETRLAFSDIDLELTPRRILGLVGGSGAGKSSLARCLALLEQPDSGRLLCRGLDLEDADAGTLRSFRADVQLVFQDASRSFNPLWTAHEVLEEPLLLASDAPARERRDRVLELASWVGIEPAQLGRPARGFSGGQMKRLSLARALACEPEALILDEPFSGLDLSLKAQMANLLRSLQERRGFACLYISHDLTMVARLAEEVAVMDRGQIVERGTTADVLAQPIHAATQALVAAGDLALAEAGG